MKKLTTITLSALFLMIGAVSYQAEAQASLVQGIFNDEIDWDQNGTFDEINFSLFGPRQYITVGNSGFTYTHDINDHLVDYGDRDINIDDITRLEDVTLRLEFTRTRGLFSDREDWFATTSEGDIGKLASRYGFTIFANFHNTRKQTFSIGDTDIIANLLEDGLLTITLDERTRGNDSFRLWNSTLSGTYVVNPEPSTVALLGIGFMGFIAHRRLKRK